MPWGGFPDVPNRPRGDCTPLPSWQKSSSCSGTTCLPGALPHLRLVPKALPWTPCWTRHYVLLLEGPTEALEWPWVRGDGPALPTCCPSLAPSCLVPGRVPNPSPPSMRSEGEFLRSLKPASSCRG